MDPRAVRQRTSIAPWTTSAKAVSQLGAGPSSSYMYMDAYVCMYVCMYVCIYIYMYVYR